MAKTYGQIDQRFAYITQEAAQPLDPNNPYELDPDGGVYFQQLRMGDETDSEGNPVLDENGNPRQIPVDWDETATVAEYDQWKIDNGVPRAAGGEETPEYVEGNVYDLDGVLSLYGTGINDDSGEVVGFLPLNTLPDEVLADLVSEGKITAETMEAMKAQRDAGENSEPAPAEAGEGEQNPQ